MRGFKNLTLSDIFGELRAKILRRSYCEILLTLPQEQVSKA